MHGIVACKIGFPYTEWFSFGGDQGFSAYYTNAVKRKILV
jgi:hypothetical protein